MEDRVTIIQHKGKDIMLLDFTNCTPGQMLAIVNDAQATVAEYPRNSVLTLADFAGAQVDKAVATRIKEALVLDRPYVKRSAWVGTESLPHVFYENFKNFSQREFPTFKTREAAMDWLAEEE